MSNFKNRDDIKNFIDDCAFELEALFEDKKNDRDWYNYFKGIRDLRDYMFKRV